MGIKSSSSPPRKRRGMPINRHPVSRPEDKFTPEIFDFSGKPSYPESIPMPSSLGPWVPDRKARKPKAPRDQALWGFGLARRLG
jgi:hypothetical protein